MPKTTMAPARPNNPRTKRPRKPVLMADVMLGRLARWLRLLGFATNYDRNASDDALLKAATKKKAILLTRNRKLAQKARDFCRCVLIRSNDLQGQFREVVAALKLKVPKTFSTAFCPVCGHALKRVPKASVQAEVWPRIFERQRAFWQCQNPKCGQLYWKGTHANEIQKTIRRLKTKH